MSKLFLRFIYLILGVLLFGCGKYSESEINSLKMINRTFEEINALKMQKNFKIIDELENVVYEKGERPREVAVLKADKNFDQLYKETLNKISLLDKNNNSFNRQELQTSLKELLYQGEKTELRFNDSLLFDTSSHYSVPEIQSLHLNNFKLRIILFSSRLISFYADQVGEDCYRFDAIYPMVLGNEIIEEGSVYKTEIFLTATTRYVSKVEFKLNGKEQILTRTPIQFEIPPSPSHFEPNGICKKLWNATLTFRIHRKDTIVNLYQDYYVRKSCM